MLTTQLSLRRFTPDTQLLLIATGIFAVSFFGIQQLLKILYLLRLGYDLSYIGIFSAAGSLAYMFMSLPSGMMGNRFSNRTVMLAGGIVTILGMALLPLVEFVPNPWAILASSANAGARFWWLGLLQHQHGPRVDDGNDAKEPYCGLCPQ